MAMIGKQTSRNVHKNILLFVTTKLLIVTKAACLHYDSNCLFDLHNVNLNLTMYMYGNNSIIMIAIIWGGSY